MSMQEYIERALLLDSDKLELLGIRDGWYNKCQKAAGLSAEFCLKGLPILMGALTHSTAVADAIEISFDSLK